jgi:hypothetical protein
MYANQDHSDIVLAAGVVGCVDKLMTAGLQIFG